MLRYFSLLLIVTGGTLLLASCTRVIEEEVKLPQYPVAFSESQDHPSCGCQGSKATLVVNTKAENWFTAWRYKTRIGSDVDFVEGNRLVPAEENVFVACTIADTGGGLGCTTFNSDFEFTQRGRAYSTQALRSFGQALQLPSIQTCQALCAQDHPSCLELGPRYAAVTLPIIELYNEATEQQFAKIEKSELLRRLNLDEQQDLCERGDVHLGSGHFHNEGLLEDDQYCVVSAFSLPALERQDNPGNMQLALPRSIQGEVAEVLLSNGQGDIALFEDEQHAPYVKFTGSFGEELTGDFGGHIQSAAMGGNGLVIQTSFGCLVAREK